MATRKQKSLELNSQTDPKAPLDGAALLRAAKPVLTLLQADLLGRADNSPNVTATLHEQHERALKADRTADDYLTWRRNFVGQVAAAWFLSVVFVRTLEDRKLIARNRIAGPGALDSQKSFFALAPSLSERDYLLTVFRELSHLPAAADLFDTRHNPVWLLAPSAHAAQQLLQLFRTPSDVVPAFRFGGDTRFLGDLYQDLSEDVRARYALLQTPHFVESFILDQTLEPAIERFGLNDATLIDPTCGSGHFLLGAFERLLAHRLSAEPGVDVRQAARKALDAVSGTDINPYAVSIARFRLTLSFLERAEYTQLRDAPKLPLHLAVADSLLHNYQHGLDHATGDSDKYQQTRLGETATTDIAAWEGDLFTLEDLAQTREVLGRRYAAVVGNPPYITVKDAKLREVYRKMYPDTCSGKYSLAAPFCERFFQLGREGAAVGMITANSFMKREFGAKLIEQYLPRVNLTSILNTSGAYIPGHGTPTVLLFGTSEKPVDDEVLTVLANRGEPSTPDDPEQGFVWRSIVDHFNEVGFENEYVTVTRTPRQQLQTHPWSLSGGGATDLKALLEEQAEGRLEDIIHEVGVMAVTGEDEVYVHPSKESLRRHGLEPEDIADFGIGENIRDWGATYLGAVYPHDSGGKARNPISAARYLWTYRTTLRNYIFFGKTKEQRGLYWWEYGAVQGGKFNRPESITFAFVATHNHFVLDRGGKVFNRSAPIIKLPASATEDDHYALLAYLNSSTACFWMKQVFYPKASGVGDISVEKGKPEANRYEFAGTGLKALPLPQWNPQARSRAIELARNLEALAEEKERLSLAAWLHSESSLSHDAVLDRANRIAQQQLVLQEELDWLVYESFGLTEPCPATSITDATLRPFEALQSGRELTQDSPWYLRQHALRKSRQLKLLETPVFKRLWLGRQGVFGHSSRTQEQEVKDALSELAQELVETRMKANAAPIRLNELRRDLMEDQRFKDALTRLNQSAHLEQWTTTSTDRLDAVPYLAAHRYTESGLEKYAAWERTWDLQRQEDAGKSVGDIPVPPKYDSKDYAAPHYWSLRGKLDVPKERFISYPGCESDEDGQPVYGWAGWNHRQRAVALATLYTQRKSEEGWKKERLQPMLAGLLELLPWLDQWHNQPDADFDGAIPAAQFREFLDAECAEHGFTYEDLRNWRPTRTAGGKKKAAARATPTKEKLPRKTQRGSKSGAPAADTTGDSLADGAPDGSDTAQATPAPAKPKRTRKNKPAAIATDTASDDAVETNP